MLWDFFCSLPQLFKGLSWFVLTSMRRPSDQSPKDWSKNGSVTDINFMVVILPTWDLLSFSRASLSPSQTSGLFLLLVVRCALDSCLQPPSTTLCDRMHRFFVGAHWLSRGRFRHYDKGRIRRFLRSRWKEPSRTLLYQTHPKDAGEVAWGWFEW